ncbi:hypothetical protein PENSOL_c002G05700 [Penicillium solitum]|uniref:Amine oxidase domain-containing protein n=1 Tax=Penicillium solitum TaxID=60172 RepID=A0A1V6RLA1_9EURO|nr:uncharacterized protein PENSOL_c002G05700 [Penicillium solitum]OQE02396.1 hypothetical protein PENSOL_c002G05700 [Penicillium solitum]
MSWEDHSSQSRIPPQAAFLHPCQPHSEKTSVTQNPGGKEHYFTAITGSEQRNLSHEEESPPHLLQRRQRRSPTEWKYAFGTNQSPELISKWDKLSCQDRLDQIRGNTLDKIGLVGVLRWWVLGSHTPTGLNDIALHTRLRSGNSELHRRIHEHALSTDNLSYGFSAPVERIEDAGDIVTVPTGDGKTWKARSVICTVPLNVLASVEFIPRLPADKVAAL